MFLLFYMTIKSIIIMIIIYYDYYYYKRTDVATFRQLEYILFTLWTILEIATNCL